MGLVGTIGMVSFGALIGHVGPRLPTLLLTRGRGFNVHFSEHPEPVALSPHLTQRILHLRAFYWLSFVLAAVVLAFGAVSLRWGSATFGLVFGCHRLGSSCPACNRSWRDALHRGRTKWR